MLRAVARRVRAVHHWIQTQQRIARLRRAVKSGQPVRIVIGSGGVFDRGWVRTEIEFLNLLRPEDWRLFFQPASLSAILAEHVWEHLTPDEGEAAARMCQRYLRPGGYLRLAVPDGFSPDPEYIACVKPGGHGAGADDHKVLYTHVTLEQLLRAAGFEVELLEYFDANGVFHAREWNPADGMIHRSARFDERNRGGQLRYTSLVVDARKRAG